MNDIVFKEKIKSVMTDNKFDRYIGGKRKGVINGSDLWKVGVGQSNIFKQRQERKGKHYNIAILVDLSGSMGNPGWGRTDKINLCSETALFLTEVLEKNSINTSIIGFNAKIRKLKDFGERLDKSRIHTMLVGYANSYSSFEFGDIYKTDFDEDYIEDNILEEYFEKREEDEHEGDYSCNHDYEALETAYKELDKMDGESIVIVFSDGLPNCDIPGSCEYNQKLHEYKEIKNLIKSSGIETIGIGVESRSVEEIYEKHIVVEDLRENFKDRLIKLLGSKIERK